MESLKKIAEALGYEVVRINRDKDTHGYPKGGLHRVIFDPKNNPAQLLEIIEKLEIDIVWELDHTITTMVWIDGRQNTASFNDKNLTEAVLNAAEEFVK